MNAAVDEYTWQCLAVKVGRHVRPDGVLQCLKELLIAHGVPVHRCPDKGPEFTNGAARKWLTRVGARPLYIEPGSPRENGYVESFRRAAR